MSAKLRPLVISSKISGWGFWVKCFSSVSSAIHNEDCSESYQKSTSSTEIDPRVHYLRNRLCPDELIRVLDRTHDLNSALKVFKWTSLQKQFRHTAKTYSAIILKLGFAGNVDEMEGFCKEMVKDRCLGAEQTLGDLVDVFVGNGRLDEAMRVVLVVNSGGYKISVARWNSVLGALVEGKRDFRNVLMIYKEMVKSSTVPNVHTLNHLIKALFGAGMVDKALDQFRRMEKKRCSPNCRTFQNVIHGLVASGQVDESLAVMNEMFEKGVDPDLSFYTHVIPLLCRENKLREAMRLFDMMKASQFQPFFCIYESLIKCLCGNCHFHEATELFCEMRNAGFSPSAYVFTDILNAHCQLGNLEEARNLFEENDVLDPSPYNVLLQCYCDSHNLIAAKELLCKMFLLSLADNFSWNIIIRALCNVKNVKQAYKFLGKMISSSYAPDSATYSALVIGKCNLCEYEDAMKLVKQLSGKDGILDPDSFAQLMEGLCNLDKSQEAAEAFIYMSTRDCSLHHSVFCELIKSVCATGRVDEAIGLLKWGHYCDNPVDTSIYTTIMQSLLEQCRPNDALVFLPRILRRGLVLDAKVYCVLIECMVAIHQTKSCVSFFNLMVNEGLLPNIETFATLLSYLAIHSELHIIWTTISELSREGRYLDHAMYNMLIHALWSEGYRTEACQLLDYMLEKGWVPDAHTHGLLIGSLPKEAEQPTLQYDNSVVQDEVSSILSEGLREI